MTEDGDLALDDLLLAAVLHVTSNVVDEALLSAVIEDLLPQITGSSEVLLTDLGQEGDGLTSEVTVSLVEVDAAVAEGDGLDGGEVSGTGALVVECHISIALEVGNAVWDARSVDRQLLVVDTNTVTVGVRVREETRLEDRVGRWLNAWWHVGGVEANLLHLGEVVLGVLVKNELTDLAERELSVWPDVGKIEDVDLLGLPQLLSLLGSHGLDGNIPTWVVAGLNGLVQVLLVSIWRVSSRVLLGDETSSLLGLEVKLAVNPVTGLVDKLEGVSHVTVHLSPVLWDTTVTHEDHNLVDRLRVLGEVVPEHGGVIGTAQVGGGVTLLGVNEVGELGRISQEEDRGVVGNDIPVTLVSPELDRESTRITGTVVGTRLTTDSGESDGDGALLASLEDVGKTKVVKRVGGLVESVGSATLGVNNTLWDTLAVEVRKEVDQVEVLEEKRAVLSDTLGLVRVRHAIDAVRYI